MSGAHNNKRSRAHNLVGVEAVGESKVGTIILRENGLGMVNVKFGEHIALGIRILEVLSEIIRGSLDLQRLESVWGIEACAATSDGLLRHGFVLRVNAHSKQRDLFRRSGLTQPKYPRRATPLLVRGR